MWVRSEDLDRGWSCQRARRDETSQATQRQAEDTASERDKGDNGWLSRQRRRQTNSHASTDLHHEPSTARQCSAPSTVWGLASRASGVKRSSRTKLHPKFSLSVL